jgi:hypothetical protein
MLDLMQDGWVKSLPASFSVVLLPIHQWYSLFWVAYTTFPLLAQAFAHRPESSFST